MPPSPDDLERAQRLGGTTDAEPAPPSRFASPTDDLATSHGSALAIRGGALRVAGYAGGVLASLGAAAVLVRHLGIPGFGRFITVTSLIALVGGVTEAGI